MDTLAATIKRTAYLSMSIDLRIVIGHKLSSYEVINFPFLLEKDQKMKQIFIDKQKKISTDYLSKSFLERINESKGWENVNEKDLENSWANNETPKLLDDNGYITCVLNTYFGFVTFNKQTITLVYFPEHKYSNLFYEPQRSFIFEFSKNLAQLLKQDKVIYCSDTHSTEQIESWSYEGLSIDTIEKLAIEKFGKHAVNIEEAIENRFLIEYIKT